MKYKLLIMILGKINNVHVQYQESDTLDQRHYILLECTCKIKGALF